MTRLMMPQLAAILFSMVAVLATSQITNADVIFVDEGASDFRIASITNLDVNGTVYNVTFHDVADWQTGPSSRTYDDYLANSGVTDPITFNSFAEASAALNAVKAEIAAASVDASSAVDSLLFLDIPFAETLSTVSRVDIQRTSFSPLLYNTAVFTATNGRSTANFGPSMAFLEFDVASVPEPSTWALLTLAGFGFVGYQIRRGTEKLLCGNHEFSMSAYR